MSFYHIIYHQEVECKNKEQLTYIPHTCLAIEIQKFLEERGIKQRVYHIANGAYHLFIYLDNGDRADIHLS